MARLLICLFLLPLLVNESAARSRRSSQREAAAPGQFDYYLLSMSWSPDFCAGHTGAPECGGVKKFAFVAHGLWPQFERGYPQGCAGPAFKPSQVPAGLDDIMPSQTLRQHEWQKHGACSGLPQLGYFETLERAFRKVTIPNEFQQPLKQIEVAPQQIRSEFGKANPGFPADSMRLQCAGRFLSEVRVCLTKDMQARACGSDVRDNCRAATIIVRPLR